METYASVAMIYGYIVIACWCVLVPMFWWDMRRYPLCSACGTNEHTMRTSGGPRCAIHALGTTVGGHA